MYSASGTARQFPQSQISSAVTNSICQNHPAHATSASRRQRHPFVSSAPTAGNVGRGVRLVPVYGVVLCGAGQPSGFFIYSRAAVSVEVANRVAQFSAPP